MTAPPLWAHQERLIQEAMPLPGYGLFLAPGTGKSRTVIEILRRKCNDQKRLFRTLIFAPPIVLENWRNEWKKYTNIQGSQVTVLAGSGKKRLELFQANADKVGHIFITNYESLLMEPLFDAFTKWMPEAVVWDEAHRLANYKSKRSKLAAKLCNKATPRPLVYLLTGTPVMNSPMDIFQPFLIMDNGETFGSNFFVFRSKYFRDFNAGMNKFKYFPNWKPLPTAAADLSEKMKARSMCVRKEDCLDLPPVVEQVISVEVDPKTRAIYNDLMKDFVALFQKNGESHAVVANMAMVKGLRLMQLASGFLKTDAGVEMPAAEGWSAKQEALAELLEGLQGRKVIIWAIFTYNYRQIREVLTKLGIKWLELNGEMGPQKNREAAALFESSDEYQCVIAHPESAGEGLNLISASEMISYSRDFSLRRWDQLCARNYRGGSEIHEKITRYIIVAKNTIEEKVAEKLLAKEEISNEVLRKITFQEAGI